MTDLLLWCPGEGGRGKGDSLLTDCEIQHIGREREQGAWQLAHLDLGPGLCLQHWLHCGNHPLEDHW